MHVEVAASDRTSDARHLVLAFVLAAFAVVLLRTAWITDDAYLTLRTVEHAASGHGLRWNIADRTQVADSPLWLLVLLAGRLLTGETYFTTLAVSIALSLVTLRLIAGQTMSAAAILVAAGAALLSPLFVSFSTSGLAFPLAHLLVVVFAVAALGTSRASRALVGLGALAGLAAATDWATLWLTAPVLIARMVRTTPRTAVAMWAAALGPVAIWLAWTWWYAGSMGPVAWLADGMHWTARLRTGWMFLAETVRLDLVLPAVILIGALVGLASRGSRALLAAGVLAMTAWTIASGGSAMAGHRLTVPFVAALVVVARSVALTRLHGTLAIVGAVVVIALVPNAAPLSGATFGIDARESARTHDARLVEYQQTGLLLENRARRAPAGPEAERARAAAAAGERVAISETPGAFGMAAGPDVHVIDPRGHTDALVARLPPASGSRWRWGADRRIPYGYVEYLAEGDRTMLEPALARLDAQVRVATRAPLVDSERIGTLLGLPGQAAMLIARSSYGTVRVTLAELVRAAAQPRRVPEGGFVVVLDRPRPISEIELRLGGRRTYGLTRLDSGEPIDTVETPADASAVAPLPATPRLRSIRFARRLMATAIKIRCGWGTGPCTVSHVAVE